MSELYALTYTISRVHFVRVQADGSIYYLVTWSLLWLHIEAKDMYFTTQITHMHCESTTKHQTAEYIRLFITIFLT